MGNIKVEMLTERKIIPVRPGMPSTSPDRIEVDVCLKCGAVVFDPIRHDTWHRAAETHEYVQGEPTDAQVLVALNAWYAKEREQNGWPIGSNAAELADYSPQTQDRMRAALRAALDKEGEGDE